MTGTFRNVTNGPLAIEGGRVLEPGEDADIEPGSDHNKTLEDEGKLLRVAKPAPVASKKKDGEK